MNEWMTERINEWMNERENQICAACIYVYDEPDMARQVDRLSRSDERLVEIRLDSIWLDYIIGLELIWLG